MALRKYGDLLLLLLLLLLLDTLELCYFIFKILLINYDYNLNYSYCQLIKHKLITHFLSFQ
jgi:hypothetical protein